MKQLPRDVTAEAFESGGEFAWRPAQLPGALEAAASHGFANLGGEAWVVQDGTVSGLIPLQSGGPPAVCAWDTAARRPQEPWPQYCQRTAHESLALASGLHLEQDAREDVRDLIHFNIVFVEEREEAA